MLKLSNLFTDHVVLQRRKAIPVWGWAEPFRVIYGDLNGEKCAIRSGDDGKFMLQFPAMEAGGPFELTVTEARTGEKICVRDVMIGEVWIAGGQSNMEFKFSAIPEYMDDIKAKLPSHSDIRMITVNKCVQGTLMTNVCGEWERADEESILNWTAVGYYFARKLNDELHVPIGIICSCWGGTRAEAWVSREKLLQNPDYAPVVYDYDAIRRNPEEWINVINEEFKPFTPENIPFDEMLKAMLPPTPPNTGVEQGFAQVDFDDSQWEITRLPCLWNEFGFDSNGVIWFRREVTIPDDWAGRELTLSIGAVDKHDITYFNGVEVGHTGEGFETIHYNKIRKYDIPGSLVRPGKNVIAVRNYSFVFDGGLTGPKNDMFIAPLDASQERKTLAGDWKSLLEIDLGVHYSEQKIGVGNPNTPTILYENMINPLLPYAIAGFIWYQGESNDSACDFYQRVMIDLIEDWRFRFGQGNLPFLQVILAGYQTRKPFEFDASWATIRNAQSRAAIATGNLTASALDVGEDNDIHPHNKLAVGERLAAAALVQAYNRPGNGCGPVFRRMEREGDKFRLYFDHAVGGLQARGGELRGFFGSCGRNNFYPVKATIDGNTVLVENTGKSSFFSVRYGWAANPEYANLYNAEGFPAAPFRSDL